MSLAAGLRLGPYEIVGPLGEGGMGEVYRARDTRLGREVAIKVVAGRLGDDPAASARFDREWRAVARLSHPNILSIHDLGHYDGSTFAVTELVPGESLRRRLGGRPLSTQKALDFGIQIARGLAAAHQAGIVHCDLKPDNIVVTPDGHVKILDFGLARLHEPGDESSESTEPFAISEPGVLLGTRGYMAPEQARGEKADHRADIFAFGAVLYEMLTGERAFAGASPVEVLHAVIADEPDDVKLTSTNPAVRRIVRRCLEKRRDERFSSAHDLAYALEAAGEVVSSSGGTSIDPLTTPVWKRPAGPAAAITVLLAAVLIAVQWVLSDASRAGHASIAVRAEIPGPPGALGQAVFSPDGRKLAAIAYPATGPPAIWLRDVDRVEWRRLADSGVGFGADWCEWSPDGNAILYPEAQAGVGWLRIVTVATGEIRTVGGEPNPYGLKGAPVDTSLLGSNVGGAWSQSAGLLVGGQRLRAVSPDTGSATDVLRADPSVEWQRWPSFLPDGTSFVFTQESSDAGKRGIFLGRVGLPTANRLLDVMGNARVTASGYLLFTQNGALMAMRFDAQRRAVAGDARLLASGLPVAYGHSWFSVSPADALALPPTEALRPEPSALRIFDRTGVQVRELGEPDRYLHIGLTADGRRVVIQTDRPAFDVLEIERGVRVPLGRIAPGSALWSPAWSTDGARVAALEYAPGEQRNLSSIDAATGDVTTLLKTRVARWPQAWARSTGEIVATRWEPGGTSLWAIPVDTPDNARRLSHEGSFEISKASLSPDERWLAYASSETGAFEVYVQPFPQGTRQRVSPRGGLQPLWRDDGRELFYLEPEGTLVAVQMTGATMPGRLARLFKLASRPTASALQYAPLPGGRTFLAIVPTLADRADAIAVVTDWTALLRK